MRQAPIYSALGQELSEIASPYITLGEIMNISVRATDLKPILTVKLNNGTIHRNVEMAGNGGTGGNSYTHTPIEIGGLVHVLFLSDGGTMIALGGAVKPTVLAFEQTPSIAGNQSDRKALNVRDYVMYNDGNMINLTSMNGIVIDSHKSVRIQLNEEAPLRISRYGRSGDNILDGSQFIDILFAYIEKLEEKINAQSEWIERASPMVGKMFDAAATEHAVNAAAYTNQGLVTEAAEETQNAADDTASARDIEARGPIVGVPLSPTASTAKSSCREAINPYVQTPLKTNT